jgi:hypothetical protein
MAPRPPHHFHPVPAGQQERRLPRRAEGLGSGTVVGYYCYVSASELLLLDEIWHLQSKPTNYFHPQQKLISKVRTGAKVSRKHDKARTPFHRVIDHPNTTVERIVALKRTHSLINPAATQRQIQARTLTRGNDPPFARILT